MRSEISPEANRVLSQSEKADRSALVGDNAELQAEVRAYWHAGVICGQCRHFYQLGGRGSGLNGMCSARSYSDYRRPYNSCELFEHINRVG